MPDTHVVTRSFTADRPLKPGDKVDATAWINTRPLEKQGYLKALHGKSGNASADAGVVADLVRRVGQLEAAFKAMAASTGGVATDAAGSLTDAAGALNEAAPKPKPSRRTRR